MFLTGKTALVTGSTSGIGLAVARTLAREGARVTLNGFGDPAEIERLREELGADYSDADLTRPEAIAAMMDQAGPVDILVNNAGMQHVAPVDEFPVAKWDLLIALNLSAAFHTIRLALPAMKATGWGRVVNIASAHGLVASTHKAAYVAAKHAVVGLAKVAALEGGPLGLCANAVAPGLMWTRLIERQLDDQARLRNLSREEVIERIDVSQPVRAVTTHEVAELMSFLASDRASGISGTCIPVDLGLLVS